MLTLLRITAALLVTAFLALVGTILFLRVSYFWEHNAVLREIREHPHLDVVGWWRHHDVDLEDFGFAIRRGNTTAWLQILDGTSVRRPRDRVKGITIPAGDGVHREGNVFHPIVRVIRCDSPEWKTRGLPSVARLEDVIANFDIIAASLLQEPPAECTHDFLRDHVHLNTIQRGPKLNGPARLMPAFDW